MSLNHTSAFNESYVQIFYNNLEAIQDTHHILPDNIFMMRQEYQRNLKIIPAQGEKLIGKANSVEKGSTTAFSAVTNILIFYIQKKANKCSIN